MIEALRWGVAPDPTGAIRPWTRTSASAGPLVDELRDAQFIEQAEARPAKALPTKTAVTGNAVLGLATGLWKNCASRSSSNSSPGLALVLSIGLISRAHSP
ncbi:hypothetical protein [Polyangium jinanense]|uniref:Uncharacterized protein n=1 Tax=Polyangium jinanense TaxID=2829994 RepID=A0A9X3XF02_9BACT|nr:hypothetical protein [Polyangium jinanense]MDC3989159.1 hypothetical protein [Polyangium jinanense]